MAASQNAAAMPNRRDLAWIAKCEVTRALWKSLRLYTGGYVGRALAVPVKIVQIWAGLETS